MVHTASPFPIEKPSHENVLIKPAVDGTLAVMKGCQQSKVKRVVITSSCVAIFFNGDPNKVSFTTDDWSDVNFRGIDAYAKSKTLAEKAAWDFLKDLPEEEKFEVATINPGLVLGPNLNTCKFTSGDIVNMILLKKAPALPANSIPTVDIRDVAQAHL